MSESLCRGCDERFTGLTAFERHLASLDEHPHATCRSPWDAGLEPKERVAAGVERIVWGFPAPEGGLPHIGPESDAEPSRVG